MPTPPMPTARRPASAALVRLRRTATLLVALALTATGVLDALRPDPPHGTMVGRYLDTPRARRAGGCMGVALALWLVSGRSPRLAPTVAAAALAGLGLMAAAELRRDRPLPSGTAVTPAAAMTSAAARAELSVAVAREAFLVGLCLLAAALAAPSEEPNVTPSVDRYA